MISDLSTFAARLRESIHSGFSTEDFGAWALELFAAQFARNPAYRTICEARRATPLTVSHWTQIPAAPTAAFKELELTSLSPAERTHVFHSSGTTAQRPSRHFHNAESLTIYEASLETWFEAQATRDISNRNSSTTEPAGGMGDDPRLLSSAVTFRVVILTPPSAEAPNSSLVHMFDFIQRKLGADGSTFVGRVDAEGAWTVDFAAARTVLTRNDSRPVLVLGTAFALVHLLDELTVRNVRVQLPPGSRVLETGGYKGRSRVVPKTELHALITERLGVPAAHIVAEYGMSELSSQAYDSDGWREKGGERKENRVFRFPPWTRAQVISPETGRKVGEGETGLLRVFDLANVFSVMAIQTEDLAVRCGEGFALLGRAPRAEPRGCSLRTV